MYVHKCGFKFRCHEHNRSICQCIGSAGESDKSWKFWWVHQSWLHRFLWMTLISMHRFGTDVTESVVFFCFCFCMYVSLCVCIFLNFFLMVDHSATCYAPWMQSNTQCKEWWGPLRFKIFCVCMFDRMCAVVVGVVLSNWACARVSLTRKKQSCWFVCLVLLHQNVNISWIILCVCEDGTSFSVTCAQKSAVLLHKNVVW